MDYIGKVFTRLTVESAAEKDTHGNKRYHCICSCGVKRIVYRSALGSGNTKSCGCLSAERIGALNRTHGAGGTPEYRAWKSMNARCRSEIGAGHKNYKGRGISVCPEWASFEVFIRDMGLRPSPLHSLDRENNDKGYSASNCRWATRVEQNINRRNARKVEFKGVVYPTITALAAAYKIAANVLFMRLRRGWTLEDAVIRSTDVDKQYWGANLCRQTD